MRRKEVIIELTSLLDVIMIMIFMVMNQNSKMVEATSIQLDSLSQSCEALKEENGVLLAENEGLSAELQEALGKLGEGDLEELLRQLQNAESKLEGYEYMDEVVTVVNISFESKYNGTVYYLCYGDANDPPEKYNSIEIRNDADFNSAMNKLQVELDEQISMAESNSDSSAFVYIVFSYDDNKIKQNQYEKIIEILNNEQSRSADGRIRYRTNCISSDETD